MDRRMQLYFDYYFSYYYQYYIWRRKLLAAIALCLACYYYLINIQKQEREGVTYRPMLDRDISRQTRLDRLYNGTEAHCISELRMRKVVFHRLCGHMRSHGLLVDTLHVTVEEQVAMFMHVVGQKWSNRAVGFEFIRSGETVSRYFNAVLDALMVLARELIYLRTTETHPKITSNPGRFHPYFEGCIGALDGTHIPALVPAHMQDRFRGRKSIPTQNVLAAVDFDLRFVYVLAGWEGSAHDSHVLQDALSRPTGLKIPEGKFFLADAGYAARPGILPPYRGVRYHLKEYQGAREPEDYKELFNHRHSSLRTTVERGFGTFKNRFPIFKSQPNFTFKTQVKLVVACCALHNWILEDGDDEYVYDDASWYTALPRSNRTYRDIRTESRAWVMKRDQIARIMWRDKVGEPNSQADQAAEDMDSELGM
ncbi:hypothetical protein ACP70R_014980 [Stipagrostis hirtigluma subsp. patula]